MIDMSDLELYEIGEVKPFYLSKNRCQSILHALLVTDAKIVSSYSSSRGHDFFLEHPHQVDAVFRIHIDPAKVSQFEELSGFELTEPDVVHLN